MPRARKQSNVDRLEALKPRRRDRAGQPNEILRSAVHRRSGRIATKAATPIVYREPSDPIDSDAEPTDDATSSYSGATTLAAKRGRGSGQDLDADFQQPASPVSTLTSDEDALPLSDDETDPSTSSSARPPIRRAARIARDTLFNLSNPSSQVASPRASTPLSIDLAPAVLALARSHSTRLPIYARPPALSRDRLTVDALTVHLYAAADTPDVWASALSSTRFNNGPRKHPPFRELYRLTEPHARDASEWAENIRWAKEQFRVFGSVTWTEYDYHLECVQEQRRETFWVSEEAIRAGGRRG
ncbi:hypothetical protein BDV95DRAFT_595261 [Massariosphaeria phaeospora]|uniref:Uncharacterized protein n=1 Tax=Massariosphaeria phaeospora TaxID=100035 RepID=A0A7C8M755_9PLEO|nr:hypothetical protein BDV95DRAFT_595261 [Massariosphaeria phaeospora]